MFNRSKAWALGLLAATFLTGLLAGAGTERILEGNEQSRRGGRQRPGYVERLTADLDLSPAQQDSVRVILERTRPAMEGLWRSVRPTYDSLRAAMQQEIAAVLEPAQRERYEALIRDWDRRRGGDRSHDSGRSREGGRSKNGEKNHDEKH